MPPTIGSLNRRVSYQEPVYPAPDPLLDTPDPAWPTVATVWAEVRTPTGRELLNAGQLTAVVSHVVTVRRAKGWFPTEPGRFVYSSPAYNAAPRSFNVVSAFDPDEGNVWVSCLCTEQAEPSP